MKQFFSQKLGGKKQLHSRSALTSWCLIILIPSGVYLHVNKKLAAILKNRPAGGWGGKKKWGLLCSPEREDAKHVFFFLLCIIDRDINIPEIDTFPKLKVDTMYTVKTMQFPLAPMLLWPPFWIKILSLHWENSIQRCDSCVQIKCDCSKLFLGENGHLIQQIKQTTCIFRISWWPSWISWRPFWSNIFLFFKIRYHNNSYLLARIK